MTDFGRLYRVLGIDPGCTLEAFKQAYRRKVAALHPDRVHDATQATDRLKELNLAYAAALDFHRLHGRLPGLPPRTTSPVHAADPYVPGPRDMPAFASRPWSKRLLAALAVMSGAWILGAGFGDGRSDDPAGDAAGPQAGPPPATWPQPPDADHAHPVRLKRGMDAGAVMDLQGAPISRESDGRWIYGPSWIRFECGVVVDWYSSRLKPLRATSTRPQAEASPQLHPSHPCTAADPTASARQGVQPAMPGA